MSDKYVVAVNHVDLAFVFEEQEHEEFLEMYLERMLEILERNPESRFAVEQVCHFRKLEKRRPELFGKVKEMLREGRVELMGAMGSSAETNFPCGESFVRNQLMGLNWAKEHMETVPTSAWLIDTFGTNAQVPQILKQFGFRELFANRFGGNKRQDLFYAKGLDGTELLVLGRDSASRNLLPGSQAFYFCRSRRDVDRTFEMAQELQADCPHLVVYYTENEEIVSEYYAELTRSLDGKNGEKWKFASYKEYLDALWQSDFEAPVLWGDLNPEFTGTYALRNQINTENRAAETLLLEADKWIALSGSREEKETLEECWWNLFFVHFHDVFSGSHQDATYLDVLDRLKKVQDISKEAIQRSLAKIVGGQNRKDALVCVNGLPWSRREWILLEEGADSGVQVFQDGKRLPVACEDGKLYFQAELPPVGIAGLEVKTGAEQWGASGTEAQSGQGSRLAQPDGDVAGKSTGKGVCGTQKSGEIGNGFLTLRLGELDGIKALTLADGTRIMEEVPDFLVVQKDMGSMQIESLDGTELFAMNGRNTLSEILETPMGKSLKLSGEFPKLWWNRTESELKWSAKFTVREDEAAVRLHLELDWKGTEAKIRLKLPCLVNAGTALYEIPFGVVERSAYGNLPTAKGEWPAQRFVAYEDGQAGLAVVNKGVAGVELCGQTLEITLIRAYGEGPGAWVKPSKYSSQHGHHAYDFLLIPYRGSWKEAGVLRMAQEFNNSARAVWLPAMKDCADKEDSCAGQVETLCSKKPENNLWSAVQIDQPNLVLSCIKFAEDGSGDVIVRLYESFGEKTEGSLYFVGAVKAYLSDVAERCGKEVPCDNGSVPVACNRFEVKTLRIKLK